MSRIVLCAIMKNEASAIERMLRSAAGVLGDALTCVVLADTGSTDDTVAIAERTLVELARGRELRFELQSHAWQNFGANRTRVLAEASMTGAEYALMLDADMTLFGSAPQTLAGDGYMVELRGDGETSYWLPLLVSTARTWEYGGVTHEALPGTLHFPKLEAFGIIHHGDGTNRTTKYERDRDLLEAALVDEPENARYVFYLAQTYRDLGEHDKAAELYERRATMGGWVEEDYYARFQAAHLRRSVEGLLRAWEFCPQRGEALYEALRLMRERGMWQTAYALSLRGMELTQPPPDHILFVECWVHEWGMRFEYSIACWWTGRRDTCRAITLEL